MHVDHRPRQWPLRLDRRSGQRRRVVHGGHRADGPRLVCRGPGAAGGAIAAHPGARRGRVAARLFERRRRGAANSPPSGRFRAMPTAGPRALSLVSSAARPIASPNRAPSRCCCFSRCSRSTPSTTRTRPRRCWRPPAPRPGKKIKQNKNEPQRLCGSFLFFHSAGEPYNNREARFLRGAHDDPDHLPRCRARSRPVRAESLASMPPLLKRTHTPRVLDGFGGFASLFSLDYNTPALRPQLPPSRPRLLHRRRRQQAQDRLAGRTSTTPSASTSSPCRSTTASAPAASR